MPKDSMTALAKAIDMLGLAGVGEAAGVVQSAVSNWKARKNVPAEYCPAIEEATGGKVRCEDLRPDVPWRVLRKSRAAA